MLKKQSPLNGLSDFIPDGCLDEVIKYLQEYKVHLTVTLERHSILGNYRSKFLDKNHRISVNGNLNKYSFLITLLHELAHLLAYIKYGNRILPHGREWKNEFANILSNFLARKIFPADIEEVLVSNLKNQSASSCADVKLTRVLKKYDDKKEPKHFIEELHDGSLFKIKGGRIFKKGPKIKKRFMCKEIISGKEYLFSPVYEVEMIAEDCT